MNRTALLFAVVLLPAVAGGQDYQVQKTIAEQAERSCEHLARISLPRDGYRSIAFHTRPEIHGEHIDGKTHVVVRYNYRRDGVAFMCDYLNFRDGQLQLARFGQTGRLTDVVPLY